MSTESTTEKYEFCSQPWVAVANTFLQESAKGADLSGITYAFQEVFTDAPAHLGCDDQGRIGWYMRVADGVVEACCGILDNPDVCIQADYQKILPLARMIMADNPEGVAEAGKVMEEMTANGQFVQTSNGATPPEMPWAGQLHDVLAAHTS
jgi:hypothetical protein